MLRHALHNSIVHGFKVINVKQIQDLEISAILLKHEKTNAEYLHLAKNDSDNVFMVAFPTPSFNSTGIAHILEHTTLCGSKKFPVRDPFIKMYNRSLSTYMNAMTAQDFTFYPFSTENRIDYYNLMSVYLDSVFFPNLNELDFKQEGWRLENEVTEDPNSPLIFKGVVFNEMKGAMSDPGNLMWTRLNEHLYPDSAFGQNSGGEPINIVDLTHKQLVDFHKKNYHPSNSKFFTYGNFSLEEHLKRVDSVLSQFNARKAEKSTEVQLLKDSKIVTLDYPADPLNYTEKQHKLSLTFQCNETVDYEEALAVKILSSLLLDGPSSPMYQAFISSNIASEYSATTGVDDSTNIATLTIGFQGIRKDDIEMIKEKIFETLRVAAGTGFTDHHISSVIHQLELSLKHRRVNFGLSLGQSIIGNWMHGGNPLIAINFSENLNILKEKLNRDKDFFNKLIKKYFLAVNKKHFTLIMQPSDQYIHILQEKEKAKLSDILSTLHVADKKKFFEDGLKLKELQEKKEDLSSLPTLTLQDVSSEQRAFDVLHIQQPTSIQLRETGTNGVSYIKVQKTLDLPALYYDYLPLFCSAFTLLGTNKNTPAELSDKLNLFTGGVSATVSTINLAASPLPAFSLSSSCLDMNFDNMKAILIELMTEVNFENLESLRSVISQCANSLRDSVPQSGHIYSIACSSSDFSWNLALHQKLHGMEQVFFMNRLLERINGKEGEQALIDVSFKLKEILNFILSNGNSRGSLITQNLSNIKPKFQNFFEDLNWTNEQKIYSKKEIALKYEKLLLTNKKKLEVENKIVLPSLQVSFASKSFKTCSYEHEDSAKLQVLGSILGNKYLHREIREKGGAYGGGAQYNALSEVFSFYSYRDPRPRITLKIFDDCVNWGAKLTQHVGEQELSEAKLLIFKVLDMPLSASEEGSALFEKGLTDEMRFEKRRQLMNVTLRDCEEVCLKYLKNNALNKAVMIGGEE
ncbi:Mitochondrial presequence protease [Lobulomyces angularis]|nr:Mitochondrial presequence protease [Lobulomyces angularis]